MAAEWKLIYWPGMAGRGEFIRLIFEEVGVTYEEVGDCQGIEAVLKYANYSKGECANDGPVIFAPPIIEKDGFRLCQMPAILAYLGKKYGLYPDSSPEDEARCMQVCINCVDNSPQLIYFRSIYLLVIILKMDIMLSILSEEAILIYRRRKLLMNAFKDTKKIAYQGKLLT